MLAHLALVLLYGALAALVAVVLPDFAPGLSRAWAFAAGLAGFLFCGLLHEMAMRSAGERRLREQVARLRQSFFHVEEELRWARREMQGLLEALEAGAGAGRRRAAHGEPRAVEEVMAEVRLLKSLVEKLQRRAPAAAAPAGGAAEEPLRPTLRAPAPPASAALDETQTLRLVREALRDDRIDVVLQPVVSLPQRKHRFYECFTRLTAADGSVLRPEQYIALAERAGLITTIDNMLLFRCIQLVRRLQRRGGSARFFCNIAESTLQDLDFFGDFVAYLEVNPKLAPSLVFEFAQAQLAAHGPEVRTLLLRLRRLGVRFSLDQVHDLDLDPAQLAAREIDFVKVEAAALHGLLETEGAAALSTLLGRFAAAKVDLIVEKIESEATLRDLLDHGIDFGQGYLFGEPRLAKLAA